MSHTCHAIHCKTKIPSKLFMCLRHWRMVPEELQDELWARYRVDNKIDKEGEESYFMVGEKIKWYVKGHEDALFNMEEKAKLWGRK